ncbi:MAG: hypothetical protein ACJ746_17135 [Bryobacteraceae bacterium]
MMKLLVIGTGNEDISYQSISTYLDRLGVPYNAVLINNVSPNTAGDRLSSVSFTDAATRNGAFQGIILTDSSFNICTATCHSLLSDTDWSRLNSYAARFAVRTVIYNGWPEPQWGLQPGDSGASYTASNPLQVKLTTAGAAIFSYLNASNAISISGQGNTGIWAYRALPIAAANETTIPILTAGANVVAVTHYTADGREILTMAMDNYPTLLHSMAFSYGVIDWVTRGVFLGSRRIYLYPQIDDLLLGNRLYAPSRPECPNNASCPTAFATANDLNAVATWQSGLQADAQFSTFHNTFAINGIGSTWYPSDDPIFSAISSLSSRFTWLSHTWDHNNLDCYSDNGGGCAAATLEESKFELNQNIAVAPRLGISLNLTDMVTPFNGGLDNPNFVQAAVEAGLQNIVFAGRPSSPNTGIINEFNDGIFEIPRPVPDLFDDVSSPLTGVFGSWPDEYNAKYGPNGSQPVYDHELTYDEILDIESNKILKDSMLAYEPYPLAFHIDNMSLYDGTHSMYTDLMNRAIAKYKALFSLPVLTLDMKDIAPILKARASYDNSGVNGVYTPGVWVVLSTSNAATIPVTGACSKLACPTYGGQIQDYVTVPANSSVTLTLNAAAGVTPGSISLSPSSVIGGTTATGTVTLADPAPAEGVFLALSSDNANATVPGGVAVLAGNTSATFQVTTSGRSTKTSALISATYNGVSKGTTLTVLPAPVLSSVTTDQTSVQGGSVSAGTITLSAAAPSGGAVVAVSTTGGSAIVPNFVTVVAGSTTAGFPISTSSVTLAAANTITATYAGISQTASLTVTPGPAAISSLAISPASVKGGTSSTGTISLTSPAPAGGMVVALTTNNTNFSSVPASLTIAAGAVQRTFAVTTRPTPLSRAVTITASYGGTSKAASLTITP